MINTYPIGASTNLATTYYNKGKLNLFMVCLDVTLSDLKDQMDQTNGRLIHRNSKRMVNWVSSSVNWLRWM